MGEATSFLYAGDYAALLLLQPGAVPLLPAPLPGQSPGIGSLASCVGLGVPTQATDFIRFSVAVTGGPKTVLFAGRSLLKDGTVVKFGDTITNNSASVPTVKLLSAGAGCVIGVGATATGGVGSASICINVQAGTIEDGSFLPYATLYQGILTDCGIAPSVNGIGGGSASGPGCCIGALSIFFPDPLTGDYAWEAHITPAAGTAIRVRSVFFDGDSGTGAGPQRMFLRIFSVTIGDYLQFFTPTVPNNVAAHFQAYIEATPFTAAVDNTYVTSMPESLWLQDEFFVDFGFASGNTDAASGSGYLVLETLTL